MQRADRLDPGGRYELSVALVDLAALTGDVDPCRDAEAAVRGYRHVVAALWPVLDSTAATVTAGFYARLRHGATPAEALHGVIRQLRAAQPLMPSGWAGHVHAGP